MTREHNQPLFVQDGEFDDEELRERKSAMPLTGDVILDIDDEEPQEDQHENEPAQNENQQPDRPLPGDQPQPGPVQPHQGPLADLVDLEMDEGEKYYLPIFKVWRKKDSVYSGLRRSYASIYKRQASQAMPGKALKQRLEDIGGSAGTKPIGYIIERDEKAWVQELRNLKRALKAELEILETFMDEKVQRRTYKEALRQGVVRDAKIKLSGLEEDLKKREKLIEEMKIFAKQD